MNRRYISYNPFVHPDHTVNVSSVSTAKAHIVIQSVATVVVLHFLFLHGQLILFVSCFLTSSILPPTHPHIPIPTHSNIYTPYLQDEKYWCRRVKNNEAAKRSRDARRLKENQISVRASFLERENGALRQEVADMRKELGRCRNILSKYESRHGDL